MTQGRASMARFTLERELHDEQQKLQLESSQTSYTDPPSQIPKRNSTETQTSVDMSTTRARATDRSKGQEKKQARARTKWRRIHHLQDFHHSHASELYTVFGATSSRNNTDLGPSREQNVRAVQRMEIRMRCSLLPRMLSRQRSTGQ